MLFFKDSLQYSLFYILMFSVSSFVHDLMMMMVLVVDGTR